MNRKIVEIVGILMALVFVGVMGVIFTNVIDFGKKAEVNMESLTESVDQAELESYNGKIVSGESVISAINKLKETPNGIKMSYVVSTTGSTTSWVGYGYQGIKYDATAAGTSTYGYKIGINTTAVTKYAEYNTSLEVTDSKFINPVVNYKSDIVFSKNGAILGIAFCKA